MTRLDRAFIKAFSKTTAAPSSPDSDSAGVPAAPSHQTLSSEAAGDLLHDWVSAGAEPSLDLPDNLGDRSRLDAEHSLGHPHWSVPAISSFTTWDLHAHVLAGAEMEPMPQHDVPVEEPGVAEETSEIEPRWRIDDAAATAASACPPEPEMAPPAAVVLEAPPANVADASAAEPLRAAFEVDSLLWPEVNYSLAAACRSQWNQLVQDLMQGSGESQKVVLVTSYRRGEGRTSLVLCLAQLLSQKQQRVAIVDADFQRPQMARQLKLLPACGWDEIIRDSQPLTEAWIESVTDRVTLLPLGERADANGLTGNPGLKQTLRTLRQQNDIVLIDAGSLSDSNDRETLALFGGTAQIDAAIIVRDVRSTSWDTLHDSQKCLDAIGIGRWDVVENFAD